MKLEFGVENKIEQILIKFSAREIEL